MSYSLYELRLFSFKSYGLSKNISFSRCLRKQVDSIKVAWVRCNEGVRQVQITDLVCWASKIGVKTLLRSQRYKKIDVYLCWSDRVRNGIVLDLRLIWNLLPHNMIFHSFIVKPFHRQKRATTASPSFAPCLVSSFKMYHIRPYLT